MAIPNQSRKLISGFPGNISHDGPTRAHPGILKSASEANNVFGRAFTYENQVQETMKAGGADDVFAGILINPKAHAIDTDYAKNGSVGEFLTMGEVYVELDFTATPNLGDKVYYVPATGAITSVETDNVEIPGAIIVRHMPSTEAPHLAVISLTGPVQATVAPEESD